jgi:MFS family permease
VTDQETPSSSGAHIVEEHAFLASSPWLERVFGSVAFFRLWIVQVVSATGDWLGFFAIVAAATRVSGQPEAAVGLVLSARIVPGLFFAPLAGVLVDRLDRKRVMMICDLARAGTLLWLPFVDQVWQLVIASLILEVFTLLWAPAKEAVVPDIVPQEHLTTVNSLSLAAAYGTFPLAAGLFFLLGRAADGMASWPGADTLRIDQESLAFYGDALTFCLSALLIWSIAIPFRPRVRENTSGRRIDPMQAFSELREGWQFIFVSPVVRAVIAALATGLIGGGMLIPLGPIFAEVVLRADAADGYAVLQTALGVGVALGVLLLSISQKRLRKVHLFLLSVFGAGTSLLLAASMTRMWAAASLVGFLGIFAGAIYVLGFTLLHENVAEELRGRIFSALNTIVRLCLIIAMAIGPFLASLLDATSSRAFDRTLPLFGSEVFIPGVRVTLWLAAAIMMGAGVLAWASVRALLRAEGGLIWGRKQ